MAEGGAGQGDGLFEHARGLVLARRHVERHPAPSGGRQVRDFREQTGGAPADSDEVDAQGIEPCQVRIGGQARIKDQVARMLAVVLLPEGT